MTRSTCSMPGKRGWNLASPKAGGTRLRNKTCVTKASSVVANPVGEELRAVMSELRDRHSPFPRVRQILQDDAEEIRRVVVPLVREEDLHPVDVELERFGYRKDDF